MFARPGTRTLVILEGEDTSNAVKVDRYTVFGLIIPDPLTGVALTFEASATEDGDFFEVIDSVGDEVSVASTAAGAIGFSGVESDALAAQFWVRVKSSAEEEADRTLTLLLK
jgi:hypothetical protein